jgi:long-subunit acyl-CoA synthetase (AMP-forming)
MEDKLVPNGDKTELRLKGPNVTPGYWRDAAKTTEAFDEEGFYMIGDAVRFADPDDLTKGLIFDGRVTEDFKLSTGTWVNFAAVRTSVISACAPLIRDVVLTGLDLNDIGALIFPDLGACPPIPMRQPSSPIPRCIRNSANACRISRKRPPAVQTMWPVPSSWRLCPISTRAK